MGSRNYFGFPIAYENSTASKTVFLDNVGIEKLIAKYIKPEFGEGWAYTALADYIQNVLYFPVSSQYTINSGRMKYGELYYKSNYIVWVDDLLSGINASEPIENIGLPPFMIYDLGECSCKINYNDLGFTGSFLDFEPYKKCRVYLPFYGFFDLPIKDIHDKYIQFRLLIDFRTGEAVYYIGTSYSSKYNLYRPYYIHFVKDDNDNWVKDYEQNDYDTIFIATVKFQLGQRVAMTQSNYSDIQRNLVIAGFQALTSTAAGAIMLSAGLGTSSSTLVKSPSTTMQTYSSKTVNTDTVNRTINPKTNRLRISATQHRTQTTNPTSVFTQDSGYTSTRRYDHTNMIKQKNGR